MGEKLRWNTWILLLLIFSCIITGCNKKTVEKKYNGKNQGEIYYQITPEENLETNNAGIEYANNEVLLVVKEGIRKSKVEKLASKYDAEIVGYIEVTGDYQWRLNQTYTYEELEELVRTLEQESIIESVATQTFVELENEKFVRPNDTRWKDEWNKKSPQGENWGIEAIKAPYAWEYIEDMTPVKIGLIDNMFDTEHEDLKFAETFYNLPEDQLDDSHGTHVAGIMAANYNSECGITGVYPFGKDNLYAVSSEGVNNRTTLFFYKVALAELIVRDVKVINVSMGFVTEGYEMAKGDTVLQELIKKEAQELGVFLKKLLDKGYDFVITKSAGNSRGYYFEKIQDDYKRHDTYVEGSEQGIEGIANYNHWLSMIDVKEVRDRIIVVGAAKLNEVLWWHSYEQTYFSDTGSRVDVMAPGYDIWSASINDNKYESMSGTSQAAPHVGGAAATLWSFNPGLTGDEVKEILVQTAQQEVEGTDVKMIDLLSALEKTSGDRKAGNPFAEKEGILLGSVHNNNEKFIEGAEVLLMNSKTKKVIEKTYTNSQGDFEFLCKQGDYIISINVDGYEQLEVDGIHITNGLVTEIPSEDLILNELVSDIRMADSMIMTVGEVSVIEPEIYYKSLQEFVRNQTQSFTWMSSNENVATVEVVGQAGIIHAKKKGETIITATLTSGDKTITKTTNLRVASKGRDTVLVLDISGSMSGTPLNEMKKAAVDFCKQLLEDEYNNRVGIVFYDDQIKTISLTNDLDSLVSTIEQVSSGGSTNMEGGIAAANNMLIQQGKTDNIKNIVVMADGLPNQGKTSSSGSMNTTITTSVYQNAYANAVVDTAQEAMKTCNMYSLGFFHDLSGNSLDFATELMKKLTNQADGYHQVEQAENLQFAFGDISEEISDGSKIIINIACPVDVSVTHNGETLCSAESSYNDKTSFGRLQLLGAERDIKVVTLNPDTVYNIELTGTDEGEMNYSVNYLNEKEEIIDSREFVAVPITANTQITSNTSVETENMDLNIDENGDGVIDSIWSAAENKLGSITFKKESEVVKEDEKVTKEQTKNPIEETKQKEKSFDIETWKIALIVLGVLCFVVMIVVIILVCIPKQNTWDDQVDIIEPKIGKSQSEVDVNVEKTTEDNELVFEPSISILSGPLAGAEIPIYDKEIIYIGKDPRKANIALMRKKKKILINYLVIYLLKVLWILILIYLKLKKCQKLVMLLLFIHLLNGSV